MNRPKWMYYLILMLGTNFVLAEESVLSFDEMRNDVEAGDRVRITLKSGDVFQGKVKDISTDSLWIKGREDPLAINSIQLLQKRRHDPWWNGFLIGAGAGAAGGALIAASQCSNDSECAAIARVVYIPAGFGFGMAMGALIDSSISKYDTLFNNNQASDHRRFQISPFVSRDQKGVGISFVF